MNIQSNEQIKHPHFNIEDLIKKRDERFASVISQIHQCIKEFNMKDSLEEKNIKQISGNSHCFSNCTLF